MIWKLGITLFLLVSFTFSAFAQKYDYPAAKKADQVDNYHGTNVSDPYRWLEDPDSVATRAWVNAENKLTNAYLATIPERTKLRNRFKSVLNYERISIPFHEGGKYFYSKNDGLQNQSVLYITDSVNSPGRVLLDPNKFSKDGTTSLAGIAVSPKAKTLAYGISKGGSDWREWHFMDIKSGKMLKDKLKNIKFSSVSWTKDGEGVYYSRYPAPNEKSKLEDANFSQKLYFHRMGTPQRTDVLIYERPDNPKLGVGGFVTDDGNWLVINVGDGTSPKNQVYYKDLRLKDSKILPLVSNFVADYTYIGNVGSNFYFRTDRDAPLGKLVSISLFDEKKDWKTIIPEGKNKLGGVSLIDQKFIVKALENAQSRVKVYDLFGNFQNDVDLPGIGTVGGFNGKRTDKESFYTFSSYNKPPTTYRYSLKTGKSTVFRKTPIDFDSDAYEVKQQFYESKDGTKVPMFIVHKKGITLDGNNPTLLYGYGGFNISLTPRFSATRIPWLEMGGVYVVTNLRGGGEYGENWHKAGTKLQKQNVFDDFIAAAEWLIENKYTNSKKLAIQGGSNGGLLVGAVLNQRPDLFGAALPAVGVMDMLRYHKFTIGWAWKSDYGSSESPEEFKALYAYSPLHNIKPDTNYPAVLITTADHDDRVVPAHSFKYAAALQAAQGGDAPVLIRIETKAGHGAGKPISKVIDEQTDIYGFLIKNLNLDSSKMK